MARAYGYRLDEIHARGIDVADERLAAWTRAVDAANAAWDTTHATDPDSADWEATDDQWMAAFTAMKKAWLAVTGRRWGEGAVPPLRTGAPAEEGEGDMRDYSKLTSSD